MSENRIRHLDALISADAWHKKKNHQSRKLEVFAHISFHEGRLGGGENDLIEFKLRLHSAELIARPVGNVKINPESIFDQSSTQTRKHAENIKSLRSSELDASTSATIKPSGLFANIGVGAKAKRSYAVEEEISFQHDFFEISVTTSYDNHRNPIWRFSPAKELEGIGKKSVPYLSGRGWDPKAQPILAMLVARNSNATDIEPEVHLTLRCRREDLSITDIRYKSENGKWNDTKKASEAQLLLAEEHLKNKLEEKGLLYESSGGSHSIFTLCDLVSA